MSIGHLINYALIILMLFLAGVLVFFKLTEKRHPRRDPHDLDSKYTIPGMIEYVKAALNDMTTSNIEHLGLTEDEYNRRMNQRLQLQKALKSCSTGDLQDKNYVKNTIFDLLLKTYGLNEKNINQVIPFDNKKALTAKDKFEIILYLYKKKHGYDAVNVLFEAYALAELVSDPDIDDEAEVSYKVTGRKIDEIFKNEYKSLSFEDMLMIVVQRIYQEYKGFGVIDELRDMKIDGLSGGVSGVPIDKIEPWDDMSYLAKQMNTKKTPLNYDSVWILFKGKPIHLEFLSFESEAELRRVCQNIYRYNNPGQLSETNGYKINEMKDGSRVVVVRPGFSESWAFFVRKFDTAKADLEHYIPQDVKGRKIAIKTIRYLVRSGRITAVTGPTGSGKTTLLMAMAGEMYKTHSLRVFEMAFELHLRKIFSDWNVLTIRETDSISGQEGLDVTKKLDGTAYMLGEIAQDEVVPWMIQMAQQADVFFTHHAKTFKALVKYLRNSLLKMRIFSNELIAEEQIVSVLNFDIHLVRKRNGQRYIERITECIPLIEDNNDFSVSFREIKDPEERMAVFMESFMKVFKKNGNRKLFDERNIVEYRNGEYVAVHPISERHIEEMMDVLTDKDQADFKQFIEETWR
ncbi:ATP-binding cassette domain-containing protein [Paenibacillus oralis]|uniref:ATP-binding cassette domain-containing protein n=1 Tax=Paenibacillus oralis TaxID=2490856 RepID=A0A3P3TAB5_9BACL|nr:ATPase, T2SS/T4P/T4SS family [Paenibacillus oralis]RRJ54890.1 ATP-binding cassette domain-containing protein [Paenibacillus oralis]